ncbi:MAG: DsrE family protein [Sulfurimonas sp.]|jgi:predicted peroxiredoxin
MKKIGILLASLLLATTVFAAQKGAFFANITSSSIHKATMATKMSFMFQKDGHATTVFLNDQGVMIGAKTHKEYAKAQNNLKKFIKQGGTVLVCPMCLKYYNVDPKDLIDGAQIANHQAVEAAIFAPNTTALSW